MKMSHAKQNYSPLYFLASLGAGGLAVTFFMYLFFWVPHPGQPVPIFEDIAAAWVAGSAVKQAIIAVAMIGVAIFSALNIALLIWNLRQWAQFRANGGWEAARKTNAQTQKMALPLALAMTVNVGFILGLVFVPGLWSIVEYLFPLAMIAFLLIGYLAFVQLSKFLARVITEGTFDCETNGSFAQLLPAFTISMIGVGLAAPAAMSTTAVTAGISLILSTFFLVTALVLTAVSIVMGARSMMVHGIKTEMVPTVMVVIPIMTVVGILIMRQNHGLHVHFDAHPTAATTLRLLTVLLSIQALFAVLGSLLIKRTNYLATFLSGAQRSAGSYALVCPGVALSVMLHFWLNKGLVATGLVVKYSLTYDLISALAIVFQVLMIALVLRLHRLHFGKSTVSVVAA
jgi:hypothetical protein